MLLQPFLLAQRWRASTAAAAVAVAALEEEASASLQHSSPHWSHDGMHRQPLLPLSQQSSQALVAVLSRARQPSMGWESLSI